MQAIYVLGNGHKMLFISLCDAKMRYNAKKGVNITICSAIKMEIRESIMVCFTIYSLDEACGTV